MILLDNNISEQTIFHNNILSWLTPDLKESPSCTIRAPYVRQTSFRGARNIVHEIFSVTIILLEKHEILFLNQILER